MKKLFYLVLLILCLPMVVSAKTITKEEIQNALEIFSNSENENSISKDDIKVTDNTITIKDGETSYIINYDQTDDEFILTSNTELKNGMTYDEYNSKLQNSAAFMLLYPVVPNVMKNIKYEDGAAYIMAVMMQSAFGALSDAISNPKYMIVDGDMTVSTSSDTTIIKKEDFPNHVVEYTKAIYGDPTKTSYTDKEEGINSIKSQTSLKNITENSLNLVSTMAINKNADFSKLDGYYEKFKDDLDNTFSDDDKKTTSNEPIKVESENKIEVTSTDTVQNPKTGITNDILPYLLVIVSTVLTLVLANKKLNIFKNY